MSHATCPHQSSAPVALLRELPRSQAGDGRHACPVCAYRAGFKAAIETMEAQAQVIQQMRDRGVTIDVEALERFLASDSDATLAGPAR